MNRIGATIWRTASIDQIVPEFLASDSEWIGERERHELAHIRDTRRRLSALAARYVAKCLYHQCEEQAISPRSLDITSRDEAGRHVRPCLYLAGEKTHYGISLTHTDQLVLVALSLRSEVALGVDLVRAKPPGASFVRTWFSACEQDLVRTGDQWEACRVWAIKEAVYKAVNRGEPFRPRQVVVRRLVTGDYVSDYGDGCLCQRGCVHWWQRDQHIAVLVTDSYSCHEEQELRSVQEHSCGERPIQGCT